MRKYVRDKARAKDDVLRLRGAYLDSDGLPASESGLSETDVRMFCLDNGMAYRENLLSARNLFWARYRNLQRTPLRSRPRRPFQHEPVSMEGAFVVLRHAERCETRKMPYDEYLKDPPGCEWMTEKIVTPPSKPNSPRAEKAYSQGMLF